VAIFRRFVDDIWPLVPTILRRKSSNVLNLCHRANAEINDAIAEALEQYIAAWNIDDAPGWLLDEHWGPYHNIQRNGLSDADFKRFIHAKRLLNKSWGTGDQALRIFGVLLPTAVLSFDYFPPKSWVVNINGVSMADADLAVKFMTKKPSPQGGGFSVAGDNGIAIIVDPFAFNYGSVYGVMGVDYQVTGWFTSVYGDPGSAVAGYAHAQGI
jgi:hypothetical protein